MGRMDGLIFSEVPQWDALFGLSGLVDSGLLLRNVTFADLVPSLRGQLVYLATPYRAHAVDAFGHWSPARSEWAGTQAALWAAQFAANGVTALSPVVQGVAMLQADLGRNIDPLDAATWSNWCAPLLRVCRVLVVPPIDGRSTSLGVWAAVCFALRHNCRVIVMDRGVELGGGFEAH